MEKFSRYIRGENLYFKHAYCEPELREREFHPFHEFVYFMRGDVLLLSDTVNWMLEPDTLVLIPKETYHHFVFLSDPEDYHRCIFQFYNSPRLDPLIASAMRELRLIRCGDGLRYAIELLMEKARIDSAENVSLLEAVILLILHGVDEEVGLPAPQNAMSAPLLAVTAYIDRHLSEPLKLRDLARTGRLSESGLVHLFRKELHISAHRYILNKRLAVAYNKILSGTPPTVAAQECGFTDYSGFYRQFCKRFESSPSRIDPSVFDG